MEAEVPQPISSLPSRWGSFTGSQLGWLAVAAIPPYTCLRLHLAVVVALAGCAPWIAAATALAFGRREGRRLDAFVGDLLLFQFQPKVLSHPDAVREGPGRDFQLVDRGASRPAALPRSSP
jgi:hypothetical protein